MTEPFNLQENLAALAAEDEARRLYAVEDLGCQGLPETAAALVARLGVEDSQIVRDALVFALKTMDATAAYEQLFGFFESPDAFLRNAAVSIFGGDGEDSVAFLGARLDHADREVRKLILDALVEIGSDTALHAIRAVLHDPARNVQITAVEYLGRLGDSQSIDDLLALLAREEEPMLRAAVMEALVLLGDSQAARKVVALLVPADEEKEVDVILLPQLLRLLTRAGDFDLLITMVQALLPLGTYTEDILNALTEAFRHEPRPQALSRFFDLLVQLVRRNELREDLRFASLRLLRNSGFEEGRTVVEGILRKSEDSEIREFCAELLREAPRQEAPSSET